jgi:RHS repeat-associated protein
MPMWSRSGTDGSPWFLSVATHGTETVATVFTGTQDVISRADSPFGRGFSVPELDRLHIGPGGVNLVTGDNHAIWYTPTGSTTFVGEAGDLTFSTLVKNGNGTYTLTSAAGMKRHFDATGLLVSRVDPLGNTRSYTYTAGTISTITDHVGRVVTFNYTGSLITSVTDFDGAVTTLGYDTAGNLISVTQPDPDGAGPLDNPVTTYGYHPVTGRLVTIVDPRGEVTTLGYDHAGLLSTIIQPCGGTSTYSMFRSLAVVNLAVHGSSAANPAPLVSAGAYEIRRDEHGFETHLRRDRFGNVVWERDALGNVTTFGRSASGLVTQITRPDPDGAGPLGQLVTQLSYDGRGNVLQVTNPDGTEEFWTYDPSFSRPTSFSDQLGRITLWNINPANGLVISTTDVVGQIDSLLNGETDDVTTSFTYTTGGGVPAGLVSTMTDALGRVTSFSYTSRGLLASMTQAVGTPDETSTSFEYDTSDNLTAVIDALGRRTEYAYDNLDRLISLTQAATAGPEAFFWQFGYDAAGNRTSMIDPLGNVTEYVYDERGRLSEVIQADPDGAGPLESPTTTYDFDCVNNFVGIADALGRETELEYDGLRRLVRAISPDPDGAGPAAAPTVEMAYNNVGWVTSETDPHGNHTGYVYDAMGRVLSVTDADPDGAGPLAAPVTSFTYDAAGQLLTVTDPLGRVTSYGYDDLGRVTTVTLPDPDGAGPLTAPVTSYGYDKLGNVTSVTDPLGHVTLYAYDNLDRLAIITEADPDGAGPLASPVTSFTYDVASQLVATTDPLGRTTTFEYDGLGRLAKRTEPDPDGAGPELAAFMVYAYDLVGNVLTESNRLGHTTTYAYDNLYRLTKITDANGEDTLFTYDSVGNRLSLTDPSGNTTSWIYDALDRVIEEENELGASRYFAYDVSSNLIQRTDRNGRVTEFTYDNLDRQTSEKWMSGSTAIKEFTYSYDAAGQLLAAGDGTSDYSYTYDLLGRVTQWTTDLASLPSPVTLGQTFDTASRRTSLFATLGATADFKNEFAYDNLNRLTGLTQQGQLGGNAVAEKRINFAYLADGRTSEISRFADVAGTQNVANTTFGYDGAGRLTALTHAKDTTTFAGYGWTYDAANRMTSFTNSVYTSEDAVYTHDDLGQLLGATRSDPADDEAYAYDENGNRITANGDAYTTGLNNRITSNGTNSYLYDAEGNITRITNIATGDYRDLQWDYRNRLTKVTQFDNADAEQWRVEYVYDAFNRMVGRTEFLNASATPTSEGIFIYDGYQMILTLDGSGNVQGRTLWGNGVDQILATEDAAGNVTWPLTDHLNTVRDIVSYDSGTNTTTLGNHIVYNSFGEVLSETNPGVNSDFTFTARYTDATTGLQWNLHRWYVPSIGRWASEDPIGFDAGDPNLARYVGNGPTGNTDPSGLQAPAPPPPGPGPGTTPPPQVTVPPQPGPAQPVDIVVGAFNVGPDDIGAHSFILLRNLDGDGFTCYRAGPDDAERLHVTKEAWTPEAVDANPDTPNGTAFQSVPLNIPGGLAAAHEKLTEMAAKINRGKIPYRASPRRWDRAAENGATCNSFTSWAFIELGGGFVHLPDLFRGSTEVQGLGSFGGYRVRPPEFLQSPNRVFGPLPIGNPTP